MLAGAAPRDVLMRRVPNSWWLPFVVMAAILAASDVLDARGGWSVLAVGYGAAAIVAALVFAAWRLGLFGGADAKALMVLAFLVPWPSPHGLSVQPAIDTLANGVLLTLAVAGVGFACGRGGAFTAKVPFLVPLTGGLALAWWHGNVAVRLVVALAGR